ncbi:MAG: hypothetical protein KF716_34420 [Anaerolineae bacterium]|nr:hypothetical protein [Anaerolineae bacterium]
MTDLYNKIVSERGSLQKIFAKIPGFRGYQEMQERRDADRMIREYVVRLLKEQMTRMVAVEKKIISKGGIKFASKSKSAKLTFQTFIDKVNTAMPGYAGFFDAVKVGKDDLERLYQFDAALVDYVDKFREGVDALEKAQQNNEDIDTAIAGLETLAGEATSAYNLREDLLTGLSAGK